MKMLSFPENLINRGSKPNEIGAKKLGLKNLRGARGSEEIKKWEPTTLAARAPWGPKKGAQRKGTKERGPYSLMDHQ